MLGRDRKDSNATGQVAEVIRSSMDVLRRCCQKRGMRNSIPNARTQPNAGSRDFEEASLRRLQQLQNADSLPSCQ
jgi:hypothetical protein